ncbi:MAG: FAD-binding protein [Promicromonosporaceae bacterium]|nr:FAD-binding protein [Promicromonosporaceae bacterium]
MSDLILPFADQYEQYLRDESRAVGSAKYIAFPETDDELLRALDFAAGEAIPVTVQGARTGLDGGASPRGGIIISCERMRGITEAREREDGSLLLTARAGTTVSELDRYLAGFFWKNGGRFFWPGSTSEETATVAGAVAGGASGVTDSGRQSVRPWLSPC